MKFNSKFKDFEKDINLEGKKKDKSKGKFAKGPKLTDLNRKRGR
jgi:hypothetical protein